MSATEKKRGCVGCLFAPLAWLWKRSGELGQAVLGLMLLVGILSFWRVPREAARHQVEQFDLLLQCLDSHQANPLWLLKGDTEAREAAKIKAFSSSDALNTRIETVRQGDHRYEHRFWEGQPAQLRLTVTSTTPHTLVPTEQLAAARDGLDALYPPGDQQSRRRLLKWGEALFAQWWASQPIDSRGWYYARVEPLRGTEEEHLWLAWEKLTDGNAWAAEELPRLAALVRQAYPDADDYRAAMNWARTWHARQEEHFRQHRARLVALQASGKREDVERSLEEVLPPPTDATLAWLLYQYVGLSEPSRAAARQRYLDLFGSYKEEKALTWGRKLQQQRRHNGELLPPAHDNVALLCVAERLTGTDEYGQRCRQAVPEILGGNALSDWGSRVAIQFAYPNDDLVFLLCAGNPLEVGIYAEYLEEGLRLDWLYLLIMLPMASFGLRFCIYSVLGNWVLWLRRNPLFLRYRDHWERPGWKALLVSCGVVPLVTWALTWATLSEPLQVLIPTPWHLLGGVYLSVLVGGIVLIWIGRVIALLFIRAGYDPEKVWLDDVLGLLAGVAVLWYFDNEWPLIAGFVAFAVVLEIAPQVRRARQRRLAEGRAEPLGS